MRRLRARQVKHEGEMPNPPSTRASSGALRIFVWGILLGWTVWLLKRLLMWMLRSAQRKSPSAVAPAPPKAINLHRDPWCGTHVSPEISFTADQAGQLLHFCSAECREQYLRARRPAVSA